VPALAATLMLIVIAWVGLSVRPPMRTTFASAPAPEPRPAAVIATAAPVATAAVVEPQITEKATSPDFTALERSDTAPRVSVLRARGSVVRARDRGIVASNSPTQVTKLEAVRTLPSIVIGRPAALPPEVAFAAIPVQSP
jgi:hypothetical protein